MKNINYRKIAEYSGLGFIAIIALIKIWPTKYAPYFVMWALIHSLRILMLICMTSIVAYAGTTLWNLITSKNKK